MYHGLQEWALRTLSHGRFVSTICTRSIAESVMVSQLLAAIRNAKIPLDDVAQTLYKSVHPDLKTPDPKEDTLTLYAPLVTQFMQILKQHTPTQAQASALQSMQQLQDKLNKREQLLQDSGIQYTPTKVSLKFTGTSNSSTPDTRG